jgi:hypothetical protein
LEPDPLAIGAPQAVADADSVDESKVVVDCLVDKPQSHPGVLHTINRLEDMVTLTSR